MSLTMITLLKRREGMSKADFIAYYESTHRLIGEKVLAGYATRYRRRHLHPADGQDAPHDFDVVLELEFPDQAACDAFFASLNEDLLREISEDEERLFDRSRMRSYIVEDHESVLSA